MATLAELETEMNAAIDAYNAAKFAGQREEAKKYVGRCYTYSHRIPDFTYILKAVAVTDVGDVVVVKATKQEDRYVSVEKGVYGLFSFDGLQEITPEEFHNYWDEILAIDLLKCP